jgi:hypothetical protein
MICVEISLREDTPNQFVGSRERDIYKKMYFQTLVRGWLIDLLVLMSIYL